MSPRATKWLTVCLGLSLLCGLAIVHWAPLPDFDAQQHRAEIPAERPSLGREVSQTFTSEHDGLTAVEVQFAVYDADEPAAGGDGEIVLHLTDLTDNREIASQLLSVSAIAPDSRYRLQFDPQPNSAGRSYRMSIQATSAKPARATVWATSSDSYAGGEMAVGGQPAVGDIVFQAFYDYGPLALARDLAQRISTGAAPFAVALCLLFLPGMAIERWLLRGLDLAAAAGLWVGLSVAVAPVLLLLVTVAGGALSATTTVGILLLAAALAIASIVPRGRLPGGIGRGIGLASVAPSGEAEGQPTNPVSPAISGSAVGAFAVATAALLLRFVHAKDLALPMWVDAIHHTLIAGLIAEGGKVPVDYGPFLPEQPFTYHFGFHLQVVSLHWLTGIDLAQGVLVVGQLLSGLIVFPTYLLASHLARDRRAGLVAALIVGLVSSTPAYYVTWSRYPQLAGLVVLPTAVVLVSHVLGRANSRAASEAVASSVQPLVLVVLAALVVAGQVLTHPRVALLMLAYILAEVVVLLAQRRLPVARLLSLKTPLVPTAGLAGLFLVPWVGRLAESRVAGAMLGASASSADLFAGFPSSLFTSGNERYLVPTAAVGLLVGLIRRQSYAPVLLLWVALSLAMANLGAMGLPVNLVLSNESVGIALFLPLAVAVGSTAALACAGLRLEKWPVPLQAAAGSTLVVAGLLGFASLTGIVNPVCVLATGADLDAIGWVRLHTPESAAFLVNSRLWQSNTHAGTDAGYWLPALASRRASLPPLGYDHGNEAEVEQVRQLAQSVESAPPPDGKQVHQAMQQHGLSYVFLGSQGGPLHPEQFMNSPDFRLVYTNGQAWVFEAGP
ncbi:MAG: hypothetical protein M0Z94_14915 [Dehalococcoidales bacterium]|nr:hypothetical protein [Dehalococcoidales bacterium]